MTIYAHQDLYEWKILVQLYYKYTTKVKQQMVKIYPTFTNAFHERASHLHFQGQLSKCKHFGKLQILVYF